MSHLRAIAWLFLLPGVSTTLFLEVHNYLDRKIELKLNQSPITAFATLQRSQKIEIPGRETHYFFSYSGSWNGQNFNSIEEMPFDLFMVMAEGENIELKLLPGQGTEFYTRIKANPFSRDSQFESIKTISWSLVIMAASILLISLIMGRMV